MDLLNSVNASLAAVAISPPPQTNTRDELIARADRQRELGGFVTAMALYREAEAMHADLTISSKIANLMTQQGQGPMALREWNQALARFAPAEGDREVVAVDELHRAICAAMMDLRFRSAVERGLRYFDEYVKPYPLREWKGSKTHLEAHAPNKLWGPGSRLPVPKLELVILLQGAHSILRRGGAQVDPLPWDAATAEELYSDLVRSGLFTKAFIVAGFANSGKSTFEAHTVSLLDDLLQQPEIPALVRARVLRLKSQLVLESGDRSGWFSLCGEADRLFRAEGHQLGPLDIDMERLHDDPQASVPYDELKAATVRIKDAFIGLGCWRGAKDCMLRLSTMATKNDDGELLEQLDEQYERIRADGMTTLEWAETENLKLRYWDHHIQRAAKLTAAFEELYRLYVSGDMPGRGALVAHDLHNLYRKLGDDRAAEKWASRLASQAGCGLVLPLYLSHSLVRRLGRHGGSTMLTVDNEAEQLFHFLAEQQARYAEPISSLERTQIVRSVFDAHAGYLARPFAEYKRLSTMCFEAIRGFLPLLAADHLPTYEAKLLNAVGSSFLREALHVLPSSRDHLVDGYNARAEAAGILESVNDRGEALSGTYAGLGQAVECLWVAESMAAGDGSVLDPLFQEADEFYRASLTLETESTVLPPEAQLTIARLHGLWLRGLKSTIAARGEHDQVSVSARAETEAWLRMGKEMLEATRRDSSTLSEGAAVMAKQAARATLAATKLYENAFELAMVVASPASMWDWVQDSKARSASDLLALGTTVPKTLQDAIDKSPEATLLFEQERRIKERLRTAEGTSMALLHRQLEDLRKRMAEDKLADAVLALREGRPTTLEALQATAQKDAVIRPSPRMERIGLRGTSGPRRVLFVDYGFYYYGGGFIVIAEEGKAIYFDSLQVTAQEAAEWKDVWLSHRPPDPDSPVSADGADDEERYNPRLLDDGEDAALTWLARLAQPLVRISRPGDLLVLCPSETLHGIPIHAAKIDAGNGAPPMHLIERNPVVYTASMTLTQQCMARATTPAHPPGSAPTAHTILGAFRHPEPIQAMAARISHHFPARPSTIAATIATRLDKPTLQSALATSKTLLFFGHCSTTAAANGQQQEQQQADQYLLLADQPPSSPFPTADDLRDRFTVSDILATRVGAPLVTLVACGSAAQHIRPGDEPLGLLSALLCAGANAVVGSLWPVEARVGVAFAEGFYRVLAERADGVGVLGARAGSRAREGSGARAGSGAVDLAVVLQEAVVGLMRSHREEFETGRVVDWAAFTLNGAWVLV